MSSPIGRSGRTARSCSNEGIVMAKQIEMETLRGWLESQRPVAVLDVRTDHDHAQWAIPGSLHINAYDALRVGRPGALSAADVPLDRPVVTVCNAGRVSQTAAEMLAERGFDAWSLAGGMKAWSLAWNTADVPPSDPSLRVIQVRRTGKGCLSYIAGSHDEAAVVDPSVSPDVYVDLASRNGWSVRYVLETHVHADHLSRARDLAKQTGAALVLPTQQRVRFPFTAIADGEHLPLGSATINAIHTPGHTEESTSYALNDTAVFTGDTLFTNGVGRPDLHADPEGARRRARALFASLTRVQQLPPAMLVLPGHANEPIAFDGQPVAARLEDVSRWLFGWLVSEAAFLERVTSNLPPTPPNFSRIVGFNEAGDFPEGEQAELEAGANRCAVR